MIPLLKLSSVLLHATSCDRIGSTGLGIPAGSPEKYAAAPAIASSTSVTPDDEAPFMFSEAAINELVREDLVRVATLRRHFHDR
jgi:hypothetical protein